MAKQEHTTNTSRTPSNRKGQFLCHTHSKQWLLRGYEMYKNYCEWHAWPIARHHPNITCQKWGKHVSWSQPGF